MQTQPQQGCVIAFLGASGGVGCTTLAVNLGCTLAQTPDHQAALIDLDLFLGDADVDLDVQPTYWLDDIALNSHPTMLMASLSTHPTGLALLPRPLRMPNAVRITPEAIQSILSLLRGNYSHLLLDLSKGYTPIDRMALHQADSIVLVTQLELSSLRNTVLMLTAFAEENLTDKVRIVVNRVGAEFGGDAIGLRQAAHVLGRTIDWQVPHDPKPLLAARATGAPLIEYAAQSRAQLSIAGLAEYLFGRREANEIPSPIQRRNISPNFLQSFQWQ